MTTFTFDCLIERASYYFLSLVSLYNDFLYVYKSILK
jgi:hypothetical protein